MARMNWGRIERERQASTISRRFQPKPFTVDEGAAQEAEAIYVAAKLEADMAAPVTSGCGVQVVA